MGAPIPACPHQEGTVARPLRRLPAPALVPLLLAACGGGSGPVDNGEAGKPAAQILKDTVAALRNAESVNLYGQVPTTGETVGMDLHYNRSGNLTGTITIDTTKADLVIAGGRTYLRGRALFARFGGDQAASVIGDHWVSVPGGSGPGGDILRGLATFTDFGKLADLFSNPSGGAVTKGAAATVDGRPAVALRDSDSTLYVATTGKPYPVELKPDSGSAALHFASWDAPVEVSAPRDALDFSSIGGGAAESPGSSPSPTP
jgi:hypothetical protein